MVADELDEVEVGGDDEVVDVVELITSEDELGALEDVAARTLNDVDDGAELDVEELGADEETLLLEVQVEGATATGPKYMSSIYSIAEVSGHMRAMAKPSLSSPSGTT
jgi:hypothetical protein